MRKPHPRRPPGSARTPSVFAAAAGVGAAAVVGLGVGVAGGGVGAPVLGVPRLAVVVVMVVEVGQVGAARDQRHGVHQRQLRALRGGALGGGRGVLVHARGRRQNWARRLWHDDARWGTRTELSRSRFAIQMYNWRRAKGARPDAELPRRAR
jgi:hypothetical protein